MSPATPAERAMAQAVATFIRAHVQPGERLHPLVALAHISRAFPGIGLDTALVGFVFRELLDVGGHA
jgi:hypothetical protein